MEPANDARRSTVLDALLAGFQGGMVGVCWMLAWLGVSSSWHRRSFWSAENLMASAFYPNGAIRNGFAGRTLSGMALYLLLYSVLGALFALAVSDRLSRVRVLLGAVLFALAWYYLTFQLIWKTAIPLVALLHSAAPTVVGHVIYGTMLGRYPKYLPRRASVPPAEGVSEALAEGVSEAPVSQVPEAPAGSGLEPDESAAPAGESDPR